MLTVLKLAYDRSINAIIEFIDILLNTQADCLYLARNIRTFQQITESLNHFSSPSSPTEQPKLPQTPEISQECRRHERCNSPTTKVPKCYIHLLPVTPLLAFLHSCSVSQPTPSNTVTEYRFWLPFIQLYFSKSLE